MSQNLTEEKLNNIKILLDTLTNNFKENIRYLEVINKLITTEQSETSDKDFHSKDVLELDDGSKNKEYSDSKIIAENQTGDEMALFEDSSKDDSIMNRRIELHKQMGTYKEPSEHVEPIKPTENNTPAKITPLSKLSKKELDILMKQIFKEALFNVEKLLDIKRDDPLFTKEVNKESDRLLANWINSN